MSKQHDRKRWFLGLALLLGVSTSATAGTLVTPPFPGLLVSSGSAYCSATNLGTTDALVTYELFDDYGYTIGPPIDFTLPPGRTYARVGASLSNNTPSWCRFTFSGKVRGSFNYVNGTVVTVIPATK